MQFQTIFTTLLLAASSVMAMPNAAAEMEERSTVLATLEARCVANLPICQGASYVGNDNCKCDGQKGPCGNWKCGWDGPRSIMNCGSQGSGCQWIN